MKKMLLFCAVLAVIVAVGALSSCRAQRRIAFTGDAVSCAASGCDTIKYHVTLDEVYTGVKKTQ